LVNFIPTSSGHVLEEMREAMDASGSFKMEYKTRASGSGSLASQGAKESPLSGSTSSTGQEKAKPSLTTTTTTKSSRPTTKVPTPTPVEMKDGDPPKLSGLPRSSSKTLEGSLGDTSNYSASRAVTSEDISSSVKRAEDPVGGNSNYPVCSEDVPKSSVKSSKREEHRRKSKKRKKSPGPVVPPPAFNYVLNSGNSLLSTYVDVDADGTLLPNALLDYSLLW
jgi:hypothetical protein